MILLLLRAAVSSLLSMMEECDPVRATAAMLSFVHQIEERTIIMSLRFLTAVQTCSSDGSDVHFFSGWWLRPSATDEHVCYLPATLSFPSSMRLGLLNVVSDSLDHLRFPRPACNQRYIGYLGLLNLGMLNLPRYSVRSFRHAGVA